MMSEYLKYAVEFIQKDLPDRRASVYFCKGLYLFVILKILFLWNIIPDIMTYKPYELSTPIRKLVYLPLELAQWNLTTYLIITLLVLLTALFIKLNYVTSLLIFWISFCLSKLTQPVTNGSDLVLNLFLFLSIFLGYRPLFLKPYVLKDAQNLVSNSSLLFCKIQFVLIYLLSGMDKLFSEAWRSGDAIFSITHLKFYFNSNLPTPNSKSLFQILAWLVIIFEIGFPVLIWVRKIRTLVLIVGVLFHGIIIYFLNIPDFGIIMIIPYLLFIKFSKPKFGYFESSEESLYY
jgi:uncharacterized membrane protein YphA (DoxX/SURF4 family)